ncbi:MAG: TlpA family protein disulfide reductase [Undibacterium sp.]|nr:TlpA family protein disulfide reductase [Opitutaceae bacterium]
MSGARARMVRLALAGLGFGWAQVMFAGSGNAAWKELDQLAQSTAKLDPRRGKEVAQDLYNLLMLIRFRAEDFVRLYPNDAHRWDAEVLRLRVTEQIEPQDGHDVDWAAQQAGYAAVLAAPGAGREAKLSAQVGALSARAIQLRRGGPPTEVAALAGEVDALLAKNRNDIRLAALNLQLALLLAKAEPVRAEAMLERVTKSPEAALAGKAESMLHVVRSWREPLALKFKGLDGAPVDLATLRGKVVLLDFWATWCPPCRAETPSIVATYRRLHERGFEIVGISLDDDKGKLLAYQKEHGMTWPQQYDGGGWNSALAQRFGIHSIPAMWLVDQQGRIVDIEARDDLTSKVERLLSSK